ncbi:MAG: hypothetical protein AAF289_21350, partial [Cyanobacteria bacterium P01_A01_bin.135]
MQVTLLTSAADPDSAAVAAALERAIAADTHSPAQVKITAVESTSSDLGMGHGAEHLLCPLTLDLSERLLEALPTAQRALYRRCRDVADLQQQLGQGYPVGEGDLWLPVVWTAKGPLYGEAIAAKGEDYRQPHHLSDAQRQPLYRLGRKLLSQLHAPPSVYLLQVACNDGVVFDRLWPFPAAPALASVGVQSPDLFACHWRCLTQQP